jgi:cellulose synthase operon protein C
MLQLNLSFANLRRVLLILGGLLVAGCASPDERAQSYYERGIKLLSQQDYAKASIEFKNALQIKKDLVGAWRGVAQIEEHNRNWESLIAIRRTIVELVPQDADAKVQLALLLTRANALDEALTLVNAAGDLNTHNAAIAAAKAAILFRLNDARGAVREAQAALEIDPANSLAMLVLAAERLARGDAEGALLILDRNPADATDIGISLFKIKIFEQMGKAQEIEALLRKLIEQYPQETAFRKALVKYYLDQKRLDDAEKELYALAAANPTDVEAGLDVVRFLRTVKGPAAARQELASRISAGVEAFRYQMALAEFDLAQGNIADSTQLLEKLASSSDSPEHAVEAQVKLAEIRLSEKNFDAAERLVAGILRKDGRNIAGLKLRASLHLEQGRVDAAMADLRQALNDQPQSVELMLLLASAYERSGSIELAEKQYADATRSLKSDAATGLNYVAFLQRRGDLARAEDVLTQLAGRWPENVAILSALAQIKLSRQNWIGAQEVADTIRQMSGNRSLADQITGLSLGGRQKYEESIGILERAYAASPTSMQAMVTLVNTLVRAGKLDRAVKFLKTVLDSNPDNAEAHVLLGSIQLAQNAPELGLKSFRTAIERQPQEMAGYRALANFYVREKNNDEALKVIRSGLEQQPDSFALRLMLAGVLELKGDYEAAITEYEDLLKKNSGSLIVANNLASLLSDHRTDKASLERAYALAAILRKSPEASFKDTLGWIHYRQGNYSAAISLLEQATAALPDRAVIRYHLGMSYLAADEFTKASEQLQKARELAPESGDLETKIKAAQQKAAL